MSVEELLDKEQKKASNQQSKCGLVGLVLQNLRSRTPMSSIAKGFKW